MRNDEKEIGLISLAALGVVIGVIMVIMSAIW